MPVEKIVGPRDEIGPRPSLYGHGLFRNSPSHIILTPPLMASCSSTSFVMSREGIQRLVA